MSRRQLISTSKGGDIVAIQHLPLPPLGKGSRIASERYESRRVTDVKLAHVDKPGGSRGKVGQTA